jgi:poly-gamma-glutamate capsule biosynthesis protein CapA/YwtB (metallophosphatase superfamily)
MYDFPEVSTMSTSAVREKSSPRGLTLMLGGDVMTARGIDQVLPFPGNPRLYEAYLKDAGGYVALAERANGPIQRPVGFSYVWGEALEELRKEAPDLRLVNLETAVTCNGQPWPKGINYRMNPANLPVLTAAGIDCCVLANNHVLDWGVFGLEETLVTLDGAGIAHAGAGRTLQDAAAPAVLEIGGKGRVLVFSCGWETSGIPSAWKATSGRAGVRLISASDRSLAEIREQLQTEKRAGDVAVASVHWGGNWGYEILSDQIRFAHRLLAEAGFDLIHGHSCHHFQGIEVYRGRLILYGCGDLLNDYEGIRSEQSFRPELVMMYLARLVPGTGALLTLRMIPLQIRNFRLSRASPPDVHWMQQVLTREGKRFGTRVTLDRDGLLSLAW